MELIKYMLKWDDETLDKAFQECCYLTDCCMFNSEHEAINEANEILADAEPEYKNIGYSVYKITVTKV